jgi:hypothetical protein
MATLGWLALALFDRNLCLAGVGIVAPPVREQIIAIGMVVFCVAGALILILGLYMLFLQQIP